MGRILDMLMQSSLQRRAAEEAFQREADLRREMAVTTSDLALDRSVQLDQIQADRKKEFQAAERQRVQDERVDSGVQGWRIPGVGLVRAMSTPPEVTGFGVVGQSTPMPPENAMGAEPVFFSDLQDPNYLNALKAITPPQPEDPAAYELPGGHTFVDKARFDNAFGDQAGMFDLVGNQYAVPASTYNKLLDLEWERTKKKMDDNSPDGKTPSILSVSDQETVHEFLYGKETANGVLPGLFDPDTADLVRNSGIMPDVEKYLLEEMNTRKQSGDPSATIMSVVSDAIAGELPGKPGQMLQSVLSGTFQDLMADEGGITEGRRGADFNRGGGKADQDISDLLSSPTGRGEAMSKLVDILSRGYTPMDVELSLMLSGEDRAVIDDVMSMIDDSESVGYDFGGDPEPS